MTSSNRPKPPKRPKLTTEERAVINRANVRVRWDEKAAERVARGLLPTREMETGRKSRRLDPEIEPMWMETCEREGAFTPGMSRATRRLVAKRYADAATQEEIENADRPGRAPEDVSASVQIVFWENEGRRWRRRAARDRAMASRHDAMAHEADRNLERALRESKKAGE